MATHALKRSMSSERRATLILLIAATVIGIACAFGPLWMVRAGLFVALLGAAGSVWYAFREMARLEVLHRLELKASRDAARLLAVAHHDESMKLINTFTTRTRAHGEQLAALRAELATRKDELSTLRGTVASLTAESDRRGVRVTELQTQLAARQYELSTLEAELAEMASTDGDVVTLPRRVTSRKAADASRAVPTAAELWSEGNRPTVVDLALVNIPVAEERKHA